MLIEHINDRDMVMDLDGLIHYIDGFLGDYENDSLDNTVARAMVVFTRKWIESAELDNEFNNDEDNLLMLFMMVFGRKIDKKENGFFYITDFAEDEHKGDFHV